MFLSFIIPVFNNSYEEVYQCLSSIYNSNFQDFEVIIVNDGSEQHTTQSLEKIKHEFERVKLYNIPHQGVSVARNLGINRAKGEFLIFVDADDMVAPQLLDDVMQFKNSHNCLDVLYGFVEIVDEKRNNITKREDKKLVYKNVTAKDKASLIRQMIVLGEKKFYTTSNTLLFYGPCARLVRTSLAKKVLFRIGLRYAEDVVWNLELLDQAHNIGYTENVWHRYIKHENSTVTRYNPDCVEEYRKTLTIIYEYVRKHEGLEKTFMLKSFESLHWMTSIYFCSPKNPANFLTRAREFYNVSQSFPWNQFMTLKNASSCGIKVLVKYILYRCGLWLAVIRLKQAIKNLS